MFPTSRYGILFIQCVRVCMRARVCVRVKTYIYVYYAHRITLIYTYSNIVQRICYILKCIYLYIYIYIYIFDRSDQFLCLPTEGDWVVADTALPKMKTLNIYGTLEIDDQKDPATGRVREFVLEATYIYIRGGRLLAGWEDSAFTGKLDILLNGNQHTPGFKKHKDDDGPNIGSKVIGRLYSNAVFFSLKSNFLK